MSVFVDTNIHFHAVDGRDSVKQAKAIALLADLARSGEGCISTQVANEFASNLIKKLRETPVDAARLLKGLNDLTLIPTNMATVGRSLDLMGIASLSFWDAAILAAAEAGGCDTLYTGDMNHGQVIAGVRIVNPF